MKKIYSLILGLSVASFATAQQIQLLEVHDLSNNIEGMTLEVNDVPSASDMEVGIFLVNNTGNSVTLKCQRIEIDGLDGTENATCWNICPPYLATGSKVNYTANIGGTDLTETAADGDTIKTFVGHYKPLGLEGCSLFEYKWVDATNGTEYANVYVRFVHQTSGVCTASTSDFGNVTLSAYPNPVNSELNIRLGGISGEISIEVSNLLGQKSKVTNASVVDGEVLTLNTYELNEGVYFVSIRKDGDIIKTQKLVVKH